MWLLRTLPNNVLGHIGIRHGLKGPNACITNHSVGGTLAVIEAFEALRHGEADRAVAVGHDAPIEPQMLLYYHGVGLLASEALRPFDARHDGSVFGEGAGALMLETEASAIGAQRERARRSARRRLRLRGRGPARRSATTATASCAPSSRRWTTRSCAPTTSA